MKREEWEKQRMGEKEGGIITSSDKTSKDGGRDRSGTTRPTVLLVFLEHSGLEYGASTAYAEGSFQPIQHQSRMILSLGHFHRPC